MKKFFFIITALIITNIAFSQVSQIIVENAHTKQISVVSYDPSNLVIPKNALGAYRLFTDILVDPKRRVFDLGPSQSATIHVNNEANVDFGSGTVYITGIPEGSETDTSTCCQKFISCLSCCATYVNSIGLNGCRITESHEQDAVVKISIGRHGRCTCVQGDNCQSTTDPIGLTANQSGISITSNDVELQVNTHINSSIVEEQKDEVR